MREQKQLSERFQFLNWDGIENKRFPVRLNKSKSGHLSVFE